jgi:isoleucyl-tRNA synthetase
MRRVPEVIDVWFDSGSMPFAQRHAPFENQERSRQTFPADYICEAIDQTRGWFYSLIAISTLLFDQRPYRTCSCLGHIADPRARRCRSRSATSSCRGTSSTATAPTRSAGTT